MIDHTTTQSFGPGELERALERFEWLADELRDEVHRADILGLQHILDDESARTSRKERALVCLGLSGSAEAFAALRWFEARGEHRRVRLLHRLASRECARRRGVGSTGRSASCRSVSGSRIGRAAL